MEVVLPIEVQIPSLRIMKDACLSEDDWIQTRLDQLNLIDEKRLAAICHGQTYQKRMIRAFNKKVRPQEYHCSESCTSVPNNPQYRAPGYQNGKRTLLLGCNLERKSLDLQEG